MIGPAAAARRLGLVSHLEAPDVGATVRRLDRKHARFTPRGGDPLVERDGLWIHPSALGGLLLGVSRSHAAWGPFHPPVR